MNTTDEKELDVVPANDPLTDTDVAPLSLESRDGTPSDIALAHDPSLAVPIGRATDAPSDDDTVKDSEKDKKKAKKKAKKAKKAAKKDKKNNKKKKDKKSKKAKKEKKAKKAKKDKKKNKKKK